MESNEVIPAVCNHAGQWQTIEKIDEVPIIGKVKSLKTACVKCGGILTNEGKQVVEHNLMVELLAHVRHLEQCTIYVQSLSSTVGEDRCSDCGHSQVWHGIDPVRPQGPRRCRCGCKGGGL